MMRLTEEQIKQRLIRLQNLERLYPIARKRIEKLEKENRELRLIVRQQGEIIKAQAQIIEKLKLRVEELEIKIFGKKKDKGRKEKQKNVSGDSGQHDEAHPPRIPGSYRKPIPDESEITKTKEYKINRCSDCGAQLTNKKTITQYKIELAADGGADYYCRAENIHL